MLRTLSKILVLFAVTGVCAYAQTQPEEDIQSWNDIQLTMPLSKAFVWKPHKSFSIHPFVLFVSARNSNGRFRTEHRLHLRTSYRFPFKRFGLTHRSLLERRLREPANSWRYRPSLTFEKEIPKKLIPSAKLFVTEEVFYDSLLERFSRNRFTVGVNKTLSKQLSLDIYHMRQNDSVSRPGDLNVIGTSWKIKLWEEKPG